MPRADADSDDENSGESTVTWRELLAETRSLLGNEPHARWICETATGSSPAEFVALQDQPATEHAVARLDAMVARSRAGEPIQYVLGSWGFRHLDLAVDERVLIPRPETELVAEVAIELAAAAGPIRNVADLGTGTGAIGLAMADELPHDGSTVWITDSSPVALDVARANLAGLGRGAVNVVVAEGSWTDALDAQISFDVIVSNPPYVADSSPDIERLVSDWEPSSALFSGADGLDDLRVLVRDAPERLRAGGWVVLEHGHDQGSAVRELMADAGLTDIETRRDFAGLDRMSLARRPSHLFTVPALRNGSDPLRNAAIGVRCLENTVSDYAHLLQWLATPEVLEWYEGRDQTFELADVLAEYGPGGVHERNGTIPAIIELEGDPIGYIQLYELDDPDDAAAFDLADGHGIWSFDLYLGRPDLFGRGIGRAVCRSTAEHLLTARGASEVLIVPYVENERAIAAYRAAGFVGDHVVRDHEMHEGVMRDALRLHFRPSRP